MSIVYEVVAAISFIHIAVAVAVRVHPRIVTTTVEASVGPRSVAIVYAIASLGSMAYDGCVGTAIGVSLAACVNVLFWPIATWGILIPDTSPAISTVQDSASREAFKPLGTDVDGKHVAASCSVRAGRRRWPAGISAGMAAVSTRQR